MYLKSPVPPYIFKGYLYKGRVENLVWSATLSNQEARRRVASIQSLGKDEDIDIHVYPEGDNDWHRFVAKAKTMFPDLDEDQAASAAIELLRRTHYADKRISVAAQGKLVYRLKGTPFDAYEVSASPPSLLAVGWTRLSMGEQVEEFFLPSSIAEADETEYPLSEA